MSQDSDPARFLKYFYPPVAIDLRTERTFLLVGAAAVFAGYDVNIFGLATPQIQLSLHIAENQVGLTAAYFRIAAIVALALAAAADLVGRRRLLLFTIFGQAVFTLLTAFATTSVTFVWAQFSPASSAMPREMLAVLSSSPRKCRPGARLGQQHRPSPCTLPARRLASVVFAAVNFLPCGWRALYVIGAAPLFLSPICAAGCPETRRFHTEGRLRQDFSSQRRRPWSVERHRAAISRRVLTIITAAAAFGFADCARHRAVSKYLQTFIIIHPRRSPWPVHSRRLYRVGADDLAGRLSDRLGRKPMAIAAAALAGIGFFSFL